MWVDTAAGMLLFHKPLRETLHQLDEIDFLLIDEAPQLLGAQFERVLQLWKSNSRATVIMLFGDEYQLPPPTRDDVSFVNHPEFKSPTIQTITFRQNFRQGEDPLKRKLDYLRVNRPSSREGDDRTMCISLGF